MAASAHPFRSPFPEAEVTPIDAHASSQVANSLAQLPRGPCGFRDLNLGHTCGCVRFWLIDAPLSQDSRNLERSEPAIGGASCYCGHHACFHGWEVHNSSTKPNRVVQGDTLQPSSALEMSNIALVANSASGIPMRPSETRGTSGTVKNYNGQPEYPTHSLEPSQSASLKSLKPLGPPSAKSSFDRPSPISSHAPDQSHKRPGQRFNTAISTYQAALPLHVSLPTGENASDEFATSATEIATPSISNVGSPALRAADSAFQAARAGLDEMTRQLATKSQQSNFGTTPLTSDLQHKSPTGPSYIPHGSFGGDLPLLQPASDSTNSSFTVVERLLSQISSLKAILLSVPNFRTSLSGLGNRVDALENVSFCHGSVDELQDRFENLDGRLLDVEGKLEEIEKNNSDVALPSRHTRPRSIMNGSFASMGDSHSQASTHSYSSSLMDTKEHRLEAAARLDHIEQRLNNIEALAPPSIFYPWELEVVLLPWGPALKGLWAPATEAAQDSGSPPAWSHFSSEYINSDQQQQSYNGWSLQTLKHSQGWLFPRACGPTLGTFGRAYERLRSRGFVRTVAITGSSARHIESEITTAFSPLLRVLNDWEPASSKLFTAFPQLLALQAPFIPLRKVHKSSRLRFLPPAELATHSLWTAEFLNSSVFMKAPAAGQRRLYITQASAYLQGSDGPGGSEGWTWQKLRELPRCQLQPPLTLEAGSSFVGEADAREVCWTWDARLDPPISAHSSFVSSASKSSFGSAFASRPLSPQQSVRDVSSNASQESHTRHRIGANDKFDHYRRSSDTGSRHAPITPVSEFPLSTRHSQTRLRTASLALTSDLEDISMAELMSAPKRNLGSCDEVAVPKRRRLSKTPPASSRHVGDLGWGLTPRLSREPPSPRLVAVAPPGGSEDGEGDGNGISGCGRRGFTPTAYATPFSNPMYESGGSHLNEERGEDGVERASARGSEDEAWEGVGDEEDDDGGD